MIQSIQLRPVAMARTLALLVAIFSPLTATRADIFEWEYVNPAIPSLGKQRSTTLAPNGAGVNAGPGANLANFNLTKAYLIGADLSPFLDCFEEACSVTYADLTEATLVQADLTDAQLYGAILTGADLTGAEVRGVNFTRYFQGDPGGVTATQLYSTASYQARDLRRIGLIGYDLAGVNFVAQNLAGAWLISANLTNANLADADFSTRSIDFFYVSQGLTTDLRGANLSHANLTHADFSGMEVYGPDGEYYPFLGANLDGANLTGADTRRADFSLATLTEANTSNMIQPHGHIAGLHLSAGASLVIRDYDGNPAASPPIGPLPIVVEQQLAMGDGGSLRMEFDADAWNSTISFAPGIPVVLGGMLGLNFAPQVDLSGQIGRTLQLFDWQGVHPAGQFHVASPYSWDVSRLYTTGEVRLLSVVVGDLNGDSTVDAADAGVLFGNWGEIGEGDLNHDGIVDAADAGMMFEHWTGDSVPHAVPEPSSWLLVAWGLLLFRSRFPHVGT